MRPGERVFCKKIVVICPVRHATQEVQDQIKKYVRTLERAGHTVHWPPRDNDQSDPVGIRICSQMRKALKEAHEVHIWYDPESQGTLFDAGMLFAFLLDQQKKVVIINRAQIQPTPHKSFQNVLLELAKE
jgi:hypothetical protein